jgi:hypothetical protein
MKVWKELYQLSSSLRRVSEFYPIFYKYCINKINNNIEGGSGATNIIPSTNITVQDQQVA